MILAGGEWDFSADTPSGRLDTDGEFSFVVALEVSDGTFTYRGTGVALSSEWVLTAGHHADLNDDGDSGAGRWFAADGCRRAGVPGWWISG
ncbi:MAG: hypothetical protein Q7R22_002445 [Verrucomicrobiota bacterium JB025]|nr:trypsin-like serine protease [Verrucomicrobiota bacterium JB025]